MQTEIKLLLFNSCSIGWDNKCMIKDTSKIHGINWLAVRVQWSVKRNLKLANNNTVNVLIFRTLVAC